MKKEKSKIINISPLWIVLGILLLIYSVSLFVPIVWGFLTSFKGKLEFVRNKFGLPEEWMFSNYSTVLKYFFIPLDAAHGLRKVYIGEMLINSIFYAVGSALLQALVQFVTAYAAARFNFKIGKIIYTIVILGMIIPIVGSEPSALAIANALNLRDKIIGIYVMKSYFLGMYFLVFYETLRAFPKDFAEAAYIDGAGNFTVMIKIMAPLSATTYFTIALLLFVQFWNDYTTPMLYMPNVPTLAYGLYYFVDLSRINEVNSQPMRLAACIMMVIPTLALFLAFHNKLLSNVTIGGVKE